MIPRAEYPRPQFVRDDWLCLNGRWEFEVDQACSGISVDRGLDSEIAVPFCPESELSGIGAREPLECVWYRRTVTVPDAWSGRTVLLHFQAVDHDATVWVDGVEVVRHRGGWTPFTADLGARTGEITIVVRARDPVHGAQARGKQADPNYMRSTGIWQTVWMEPVPASRLTRPKITPLLSQSSFHVDVGVRGPSRGLQVRGILYDDRGQVARTVCPADADFGVHITLPVPEDRRRLWSPHDPFLYDLQLELLDGADVVIDKVRSYAGLRSVTIDGKAVLLNGRRLFQRLVLDFGYYPDGVLTAPSDEALVADIELAKAAGFNGARLHQKVFEERFLYHCDRLGYLVWGEFGDWGGIGSPPAVGGPHNSSGVTSFVAQWHEVLERDYSHPSIVGWCPLNETIETLGDGITELDDLTRALFLATKAADRTRPVLDTSGFSHRVAESDVYDSHNYEQDPSLFAAMMGGPAMFVSGSASDPLTSSGLPPGPWSIPYAGQPYFCSEFGGIQWGEDSWSFGGVAPSTPEEFYQRFDALVGALLDNPQMFGYCYTKLTDVYRSKHGIYRFDRTPKFDIPRIRATQTRRAAIEVDRGPV